MSRRQPTKEERAEERAFALTSLADIIITTALVLAALASGSLTMLSEASRGVLLLLIQLYTLWLFMASHRGRLSRFEYGTGKMEQFVCVVVGLGLVVGALWVAQSVFEAMVGNEPPASPLGLSIAAIVNAINLTINLIGWHAMWSASRGKDPGLLGAELSARFGALIGSVVLQITLTAAAFAKDPLLVLLLDGFGATLVAGLMAKRGISMIMTGLSNILDQPPARDQARAIHDVLISQIPERDILGIRMRRGGRLVFVEVAVNELAYATVRHIQERTELIRHIFAEMNSPVDLTIVIGRSNEA